VPDRFFKKNGSGRVTILLELFITYSIFPYCQTMNWGAVCKDKLLALKLKNKQTPNPMSSINNNNGEHVAQTTIH
jgi:hypothetical protein